MKPKEDPAPAPQSGRARVYWAILALGLVVHGRTLRFGFNYLDDNTLILDRLPQLRQPAYILQAFGEDVFQSPAKFYYRPLLVASFWADTQWAQGKPSGYRLTNLLLHLAVCALAYPLLLRLGAPRGWAEFFSLLWVVHPLSSSVVSWIAGRNEPLLFVFLSPSFLFFLNFVETGKSRFLLLHLLGWTAGLLTRESGVVLPVLCLLYLYLFRPAARGGVSAASPSTSVPQGGAARGGVSAASPSTSVPQGGAARRGSVLPCFAGWAAAGLGWWLVRAAVLKSNEAANPIDLLQTAFRNGLLPVAFLGRIFLPIHPSVYPVLDRVNLWIGVAALGALLFVLATLRFRDRRLAVFGACWLLAFMLPFLSRPSDALGGIPISEARYYVAALGAGMILSGLNLSRIQPPWMGRVAALRWGLLALFAAATFRQSGHYRDPLTFWQNAADTSPGSAFVRNNLGAMHYLAGSPGTAEGHWRAAVGLNPSERLVHGNLGLVLMNRGALDEAEREFKTELALNPQYDHGHFNLGLLYYRLGDQEAAVRYWRKTLDLNAGYADAYRNLILHHLERGESEAARSLRRRARERRVPLPEALEKRLGNF